MALELRNTLARIFRVRQVVAERSAALREKRDGTRRPSHQTALVEWQDIEKGDQALAGRLENRSRRGFGIRAPRQIAAGKTILVTPEDEAPIKAVVRHCSSIENGWYLGVELVPREKRRSDREPMHCVARITCTRAGRTDDLDIIIKDASEGGLQLESPEPLAVDQVIEVSHLNSSREGLVAYCEQRDEAYRIGVQFIGGAWHKDPFN
jgi:hypothetical protein